MVECGMTVIIQRGLYCELTAHSLSRMTLLTYILLVNLVTTLVFPFSLNGKREKDIQNIGCLTARFGVNHLPVVCMTHAVAQTNCCVLQCGHRNPERADM